MSGSGDTRRPSPGRAVASSPWIVVFAGVVAMLVLLVVALSTYRGRSPAAEVQPGPNPALPLPATVPAATVTPSATASSTTPSRSVRSSAPATASAPRPASPTGAAPSRRVSTPPAPPAVTGRYEVDRTFDGGFIAGVLISNASGAAQDWTVRLAFPGGRLVSAWVANAPQGTLRRTDDGGYTYTSGVDVAAGGSVRLEFHVERAATSPATCTVNGTGCAGL